MDVNKHINTHMHTHAHTERISIPILLIGFSLLANQQFVTDNWMPYIFVSVVSAV